jgi:hypothetical protein
VPSPLLPLATALTLALARAEAPTEAPPATSQATPRPASEAGRAPADGEKRKEEKEDGWIDVGHAFIERRLFAPVLWLDRFFSDERDIEAERSRSFLRWRSEARFSEETSRPALTTGVRATLRLPSLNRRLRRLRIVIAGEARDTIDRLFPPSPGTPRDAAAEEDEIGTSDAGLRFYLWDTLVSHADLGGGVLMKLPPGAYGRLRLRWAIPVKKAFLTRTAVTGFWRTDTHFGTTATLELERPMTSLLVGRLAGSGTVSEVSRGVEWFSELALLAYLDPRTGAQLGVAVNGVTYPAVVARDPSTFAPTRAPKLDRTRIYTRLRRDVYRRWVFLEVEPEVAWPWSLERGRHSAWGLSFRLEVQFQGREAPPPPPPPPPPEPEDPEPQDSLPKEPAPG